ncbi:unnamed protein product [Lathyrus oleraceus]
MDVNIPLHLRNAKVADLIDVDGEWNWDMMNQWLSESITCRIASMVPPSVVACPDCRVSIGVHGNQFLVGAMYEVLNEDNRLGKDDRRTETWKFQTTERI